MTDLRTSLLPALDAIRAIPQALGLRQWTVTRYVRTWSGERVGVGTKTDTTANLSVAGGKNPRVRQLTSREIIASGGRYRDQDLKVGPLTPTYAGGGVAESTIDPATSSSPTEIFWKVVGPGLPSGGAWYDKVSEESVRNFTIEIVLRANGRQP